MASGFFSILDDVAALMDDVATATKVATSKTAGILGDDLAVNAEKATGFLASRELYVLWAITKGSLLNKLIIVPIALLLSAFFPTAIKVILVLGGFYLAYEGVEKIIEYLFHRSKTGHEVIEQSEENDSVSEKAKIKSAITTDFILSVEIVIIALGTVLEKSLAMQIITVSAVSLLATVGVYGLVALIVRMDDAGYGLIKHSGDKGILSKIGHLLVKALPVLIRIISFIGTIALIMVSGGIFVHNIEYLHHIFPQLPSVIKEFITGLVGGFIVAAIFTGSKKILSHFVIALLLVSLVFLSDTFAQQKQITKGTVQRIIVHGKLLEENLSGDSADRHVSVYLPASYKSNPARRYPVVYFLHGYTDDDAKFYGFRKHWMILPPVLDSVFAKDLAREMIVVTPDAYTRFQGSMYSNSVTTGNWEDFIAKELVAYIDGHYRTIANNESRGLCGHSMGGYGALRIGEKNPEVFSAVYLLSPCCLNSVPAPGQTIPQSFLRGDSIRTIEDFYKADFGVRLLFASAAAWSPNPTKPPFYLDLPVMDGKPQPVVFQKWNANRPLNNLDQYIFNIRKLKAIGFDAGTRDVGIAESIKILDNELNKYGIAHSFEIYEGDHVNRVAERIADKMLEFFFENLRFEGIRKK